jgi:peptide deformylase
MKYDIRIYGDPILRAKSVSIGKIDKDIQQLTEDMIVTMRDNNGAGLAAQQIGRTENLCIIDIDRDMADDDSGSDKIEMPIIMLNPQISDKEGEQVGQEGCLSFPDVYVNVARAAEITVQYMDMTGSDQEIKVRGIVARAVQHEVDHLRGILLVDHMSPVQKVAVAGKLKRMKKKALKK